MHILWPAIQHDGFTTSNIFRTKSRIYLGTKLLLNELPLLTTLQRRQPDKAEWKCVSCKLAPETWSHLWSSPIILPKLISLREATKIGLIDLLRAEDIDRKSTRL